MSEAAPETQGGQQEIPEGEGGPTDEGKTFTQADVERIIAGRLKKYEDYDELRTQVDSLRAASLSDQERAVEDARKETLAEASRTFGARIARTEFDALAARRNPDFDTSSALEFIDLTKFVGDDGEPKREAIQAAVERLVPTTEPVPPSFDGGSRTPAATSDFNQTLRRAAGRA